MNFPARFKSSFLFLSHPDLFPIIDAIEKVVKGYAKFSATPKYMVYN